MTFLHLFIINKSGGLIHNVRLSDRAPAISTNEFLLIGSTFHSLHAIAAEAAPEVLPPRPRSSDPAGRPLLRRPRVGIESIDGGSVAIRCLQTPTGVKFVLTAEADSPHMEAALRDIYVLYADYALKNPFYELDMPIRCELFNQGVENMVERYEKIAR
uniref:Trafficking protein particle complex subunit n=1 Tax=Corethron hystrix TaxID=216773 RepID=A0A7S1BHZ6_9STRA